MFSRNSIDNKGLHLIGSVHYDDEPGEPGMDNAFWDGTQMAFGDGDGEIFGTSLHLGASHMNLLEHRWCWAK